MDALSGCQSILLHGYKLSDAYQPMDLPYLHSLPKEERVKRFSKFIPKFWVSDDATTGDLAPMETWFLIKFTPSGPEFREIFLNTPTDRPSQIYCYKSSCAIVGSSLYVLGGAKSPREKEVLTDSVRCLDIQKPDQGWMSCAPLKYPCCPSEVVVSGDIIFLFLKTSGHCMPGCFFYDTAEPRIDVDMTPCSNGIRRWLPRLCFGLNLCGIRGVAVWWKDFRYFSFYNPDTGGWDTPDLKIPTPQIKGASFPPLCATFNDTLYLSRGITSLYAINLKSGQPLGGGNGIALPYFRDWDLFSRNSYCTLCALSDLKLCYLWTRSCIGSLTDVFLVIVVVSSDFKFATIVSEHLHTLNTTKIQSCIVTDAFSDIKEEKLSDAFSDKGKDKSSWRLQSCSENLSLRDAQPAARRSARQLKRSENLSLRDAQPAVRRSERQIKKRLCTQPEPHEAS